MRLFIASTCTFAAAVFVHRQEFAFAAFFALNAIQFATTCAAARIIAAIEKGKL